MGRIFKLNRAGVAAYSVRAALLWTFLSGTVLAQTPRLQQADKVQMLQSKDSSNKPFFRLRLSIPEGIPKLKDPVNSIEILEGNQSYRPFYVKLGQETLAVSGGAAKTSRFALLLMDISGSMLDRLAGGQTKFDAAKTAARQFLSGFEPGVDNLAVVPFDARQVDARIRQAVFASDLQSVQAQIDNLPRPDLKGNTGLYTAIASALDVLNAKKNENISRSAMLLVLTDGMNDVHPEKGDDQGLLEGEQGLARVVRNAHSSGFTVVTIGFGDTPKSIDANALRSIASQDHYWSAANLQSLEQIFRKEKQALINQFDVTFSTNWNDYRILMGRDVRFRVRMKSDDSRLIESDPIAFPVPETSPPPFNGGLSTDEEAAWIGTGTKSSGQQSISFLELVESRLLIMAGLGLCLACLWFGVPRAIWPERYLKAAAAAYVRRIPVPHVPAAMQGLPRPNIPARPATARPPASAGGPAARKPDPSATITESKVTIRPKSPGPASPPSIGSKAPAKPRRPVDETMVTGAQPPGDSDPWGLDPPPGSKR
jgi:Ca-activated chloride channel family protein